MDLTSLIQHEEAKLNKKLNKLQDQLQRLRHAAAALSGLRDVSVTTAASSGNKISIVNSKPKTGRGRHLSPEGRARIIAAAKKRWRKYHRAA